MEAKHVLVIEDNELNRKLVFAILQMGGYEPLAAEDAETGIEKARKQRPDIILMDIHLPGMDGLTATRLLKDDPDLKKIPVVALTACAMSEDEQKALDAGCSGYIEKPINTRAFLDKLASFLGQAPQK
jgi:CheY-like chemotaxis protein